MAKSDQITGRPTVGRLLPVWSWTPETGKPTFGRNSGRARSRRHSSRWGSKICSLEAVVRSYVADHQQPSGQPPSVSFWIISGAPFIAGLLGV